MTSKKAEAAAAAGERSIADGQGQPFDFCRAGAALCSPQDVAYHLEGLVAAGQDHSPGIDILCHWQSRRYTSHQHQYTFTPPLPTDRRILSV